MKFILKIVWFAAFVAASQIASATSYRIRLEGDPDLPFLRTFVRQDAQGLSVIVNGIQRNKAKLPYVVAVPVKPDEVRLLSYGALGAAVQVAKPTIARNDLELIHGIGYLALGLLWLMTMPRRLMLSSGKGKVWHEVFLLIGYLLLGFCICPMPVFALAQEVPGETKAHQLVASDIPEWCRDNYIRFGPEESRAYETLAAQGWIFYAVGGVYTPSKPALFRYRSDSSTLPVIFSAGSADEISHEVVTIGTELGRISGRTLIKAHKLRFGAVHPDLDNLLARDDFATYSRADVSRDQMLEVTQVRWSEPIPKSAKVGRAGATSIMYAITFIIFGAIAIQALAFMWPQTRDNQLLLAAMIGVATFCGFLHGERQFVRSYATNGLLPEAHLSAQLWMLDTIRKDPLDQPFKEDWNERTRIARHPLSGLFSSSHLHADAKVYGIRTEPGYDEKEFDVTFYDYERKPHLVIDDGKLTEAADLVGTPNW